jgi:microcystin-dependent protein
MADPFVAEIRIFPFNFAPKGWAFCDGQILPISQNTALFALLGTTYGGDGKSTFALPDLQGSTPMQQGQGPGLSLRDLGEIGGEQNVTLLQSEMPSHTHGVQAAGAHDVYAGPPPNVNMSPLATSVTGGSLPHNNMMPYLGLNFCIALQGVFPPRT